MKSMVMPQFKKMLEALPEHVQKQAREGFARWKENPLSVGWKRLNGIRAEMYSVEIGNRWRAVAILSKEHQAAIWVFAGSHETYNNFVSQHRKTAQIDFLSSGSIKERLKKSIEEERTQSLDDSMIENGHARSKYKNKK